MNLESVGINKVVLKEKSSLIFQANKLIEDLMEAEKFVEQIKLGNKSEMYDPDLLPIVEIEIEELTSAIFLICNKLEKDYGWCS